MDLQTCWTKPGERDISFPRKHLERSPQPSIIFINYIPFARIETQRPDIRQRGGSAEVHREPIINRRLQVRPQAVRLRAVVSPAGNIPLQRRHSALRHGKVFAREHRRSLPSLDELFAQQTGTRLLREKRTSRSW